MIVSAKASGTLSSADQVVSLNVTGFGAVGIQLSGTFTGTVTFEGTIDCSNWVSINMIPSNSAVATTTATSGGAFSSGVTGLAIVRARCSIYSSGTVSVSIVASGATATSGAAGGGGGGAPSDATYITQTANTTLSAEQVLSTLATGLMKVTTTTGVVSSVVPGTGVETALAINVGSAGAFVTTTSTDTLTNKRITKRVVTASDATSVTANSDNADITYQLNTQGTGTLTMNADAGTPTNGQSWVFKIKSTNVQTFAWNAGYVGGTTALPTVTTGGSKIDYFTFIYDTVNSKWHFTGQGMGF